MHVAVLGGGPAGLYFALLLRKARPDIRVTVVERNAPNDTFGWGVVFSDQTLEHFRQADEASYDQITGEFAHWDDIDVHVAGRTFTSGGHGFSGLARKTLLQILQRRAAELGAQLRFETEVADEAQLNTLLGGAPDLIVAADGVNSATRSRHEEDFRAHLDRRSTRFIWLGTTRRFDAFTFIILHNDYGTFQAHAYQFDAEYSTFIVECDEASWRKAGFDRMDSTETVAACEALFAPWLEGHALLFNATQQRHRDPWVTFLRVSCDTWRRGNVVLLGDAAHTAHFSIGSGTKLAMEDAISLAREASKATTPAELIDACDRYQQERRIDVIKLQNAARNSMEWFEHVSRYVSLPPEQLAYSLLTRSQRVSHENLRLRDTTYVEGVERWFASQGAAARAAMEPPPAPMFTPFTLRGMTLSNRVVVSPMDMYSAEDGIPHDFHLVHYGSRAMGGAALVMTEMTCVSPEARITPGCTGMYNDAQATAWRRIVAFIHGATPARICLQLGHSGSRGSTSIGLDGTDKPLEHGAWPVMAASAQPFRPGMQVPSAMTRDDMDAVIRQFVRATDYAINAGFDMLELHCAHGYLLSGFISPLSNLRTDLYGGSLENRLRFPLEIFAAMRHAWPAERPMSVRISATDWVEGGVDGEESVAIARAFSEAGADILHVSTGQTSPEAKPVYGRMYQTPYSDRIRNELGIATIAVGAITEADQINSIIAAGRADLCALGRPHLVDPYWTLRAATEAGAAGAVWPWQYQAGADQLTRLLARARSQTN